MEKGIYSIKEVINSILKDVFDRRNSLEANVTKLWQDIIKGETKNIPPSSIISLNNGILKVKVSNSSYLYKLAFLKNALIKKLNKKLGKEIVKDIKFNI